MHQATALAIRDEELRGTLGRLARLGRGVPSLASISIRAPYPPQVRYAWEEG